MKNFGDKGAWAYPVLPTFWSTPIISGMGKATNVKFGRYIQRVRANKSQLKIYEKMERGRIQGLPKIFEVPPIISGTDKATNFNFCTHILSIDRNKSLLQISGKVAGCVVRTLKTFQAPIYWAHRAVFFALAQLSCVAMCSHELVLRTSNVLFISLDVNYTG